MPTVPTILIATAPASPLTPGDVASAAEQAADRAVALLEALPGEAHIAMGIALAAGVVLWLYGSRLIKPMFGLLGVAAGGLVGLLLPPLLGIDQVGGIAAWLVGLGLGAVIGLVVAMVLLKIAVTFTAGLALAIAGFLGGLVYLQYAEPAAVTPAPTLATAPAGERDAAGQRLHVDPLSGSLVTLRQLVDTAGRTPTRPEADPASDAAAEPAADLTTEEQLLLAAARVRAVVIEAGDFAQTQWSALPVRDRTVLLGATATSFGVGLLAGLVLPKRSSALVTALLGSAIWLTAAVWLIEGVAALEPVRATVAGKSPLFWAIVWSVAAGIGLAAQLGGLARSKPRKHDDDHDD